MSKSVIPEVTIVIEGGAVIDVQGTEDFIVIDYDHLMNNFCPKCYENMGTTYPDGGPCPLCGFDWIVFREEIE